MGVRRSPASRFLHVLLRSCHISPGSFFTRNVYMQADENVKKLSLVSKLVSKLVDSAFKNVEAKNRAEDKKSVGLAPFKTPSGVKDGSCGVCSSNASLLRDFCLSAMLLTSPCSPASTSSPVSDFLWESSREFTDLMMHPRIYVLLKQDMKPCRPLPLKLRPWNQADRPFYRCQAVPRSALLKIVLQKGVPSACGALKRRF